MTGQYIEFAVQEEKYGIGLEHIHEIIRMQEITHVPGARPYMEGVINLRGSIIPIISLRSRFNMEKISYSKSTRIIVVHRDDMLVGLIVDMVLQVVALTDIGPPPERMGVMDGCLISGVGQSGGELVGILKVEQILETG
ncbi:chemotaxis protein CheW [Paenibacillus hexagrammi]|uniref:Chemotaxis protein CheW n=1 Tax=Paenibacillus hexagrammi TaxID=2908839 RepID=A0ABY3SHB6_9BACL|nr:chemotaxis protein CheW [Paenibacillus sp. YPD9-1]UJF32885.1 chemotaxis protein CheW [Paenibacillus sp. YPD9-1]